ncbi:LppP/LprE family lipoprotein [Antrihabitans stalactiti]|uniref:LppP/LprE family lipoprotein n=1 Tax=Antrihabitans stalactiti TaxID=2584121 RepID=A0A848KCE4_9NOCA|nr:LppP/LprE family lipoprotein [Antrihabitans stalactiti]NMN96543.1 LppP/LprE family lipoprotein [Antrihabitans stalactiti]
MKNVLRATAVIMGAAALVAGCSTEDRSAAPTTPAVATTTNATVVETTADAPPAVTRPVETSTSLPKAESNISGNGLCLDQDSSGARAALATLPGDGTWKVEHVSDATIGNCPELLWLSAAGGNSAAAPIHVLFFHDGKYMGTATSEPYAFARVASSNDDTVAVEYKWLVGNEAFCCPEGGPVTITYTWNGSRVVMNEQLPKEVTG